METNRAVRFDVARNVWAIFDMKVTESDHMLKGEEVAG